MTSYTSSNTRYVRESPRDKAIYSMGSDKERKYMAMIVAFIMPITGRNLPL